MLRDILVAAYRYAKSLILLASFVAQNEASA